MFTHNSFLFIVVLLQILFLPLLAISWRIRNLLLRRQRNSFNPPKATDQFGFACAIQAYEAVIDSMLRTSKPKND